MPTSVEQGYDVTPGKGRLHNVPTEKDGAAEHQRVHVAFILCLDGFGSDRLRAADTRVRRSASTMRQSQWSLVRADVFSDLNKRIRLNAVPPAPPLRPGGSIWPLLAINPVIFTGVSRARGPRLCPERLGAQARQAAAPTDRFEGEGN